MTWMHDLEVDFFLFYLDTLIRYPLLHGLHT